ncbi:MAG: hypothetical protein E6R04_10380 [Spirochaetes bacterium]|nr:MAG: hypothetical protein E6R04_10380 [Spirochaetota bacterium]
MAVGISGTLGMDGTRADKVYEDAVHVARERNVMASLVLVKDDRNDDLPRQYNEHPTLTSTEVGEYDDIATATKFDRAAGATVTPKEEAVQVILTDKRRRAEGESVYSAIAFELGDALAKKVEQDLLGLFPSFTLAKGSAGSDLAFQQLFAAQAVLNGQGHRGKRKHCVLHEYQWFGMANSVSLEQSMKNTPEVLRNELAGKWYVGSIGEMDIFVTSEIDIDASDDAVGAIFVPEAILLDKRKAPTLEIERDASRRADELNMTVEYGVGLWAPNAGVKLTGDATVPA